MNTTRYASRWFAFTILCMALPVIVGCAKPTTAPPPVKQQVKGPPKKTNLADNLRLEVDGEKRRVLVDAVVPMHDINYLEFFLSTKRVQKGYESILEADVDARQLHEALLAAGAVPGSPFQYDPYQLPRGQILKISLRYEKDGKQVIDLAQWWLRTRKGGPVKLDWVYTGSQFSEPEGDRAPVFLAEVDGTLITLGNMPSALIDVNIASSNHTDEIDMTYNLDRIPLAGTKVTIILEPVGEFKKGQK